MANWGVDFARALEGLGEGFEAGQRMGIRQLQSRKLRREEEFNKELARDPTKPQPEEKGWLGKLGDAAMSLFRRAQPADQPGASGGGTATVTGGATYGVNPVREPNAQGSSGGVVPPQPGGQFGVRSDQQEVGEGVSRSAFGYGGGPQSPPSAAIPPSPTGGVSGSSGAVPPPRTAAPSPRAVAIADEAVRRAGGRPGPSASSTDVEGAGAGAAAGQPSYGPSAYPVEPGGRIAVDAPGQILVGPTGGREARGVVPLEPPGGAPMGPAQPVDAASTYPRDVGAPARSVGTTLELRSANRQQGYAPGALKVGPETPAGAIPTPQDQKRDADIIRMANQPKPPGQQPPDLIKAITAGKPEGVLPSSQDMQRYLEKIPALMKIDPERALRLQAGIFEGMRTGTMHGFMQTQIAMQSGDMQRAQQLAMQTYNKYIAPLGGNYAQFEIGPDGKSLTMQSIDAQTGKPVGKTVPVTQEMIHGYTLMATDPKAYDSMLQWRDQHKITMRGQDLQAGSAAAARAQAEKRFMLKFNEDKRQFDLKMAEEQKRTDIQDRRATAAEDRETRTAEAQGRVLARQEEESKRRLTKADRTELEEANQRKGQGWWNPSSADRTRIVKDIGDEFDTLTPSDKKAAEAWTKNKGILTSTAFDIMSHNSNMLASQALDISRRLQAGETATVARKSSEDITYKLGDIEFTMPLSADRRTAVQSPSSGGQGPAPVPTQAAVPGGGTSGGVIPSGPTRAGGLPTATPANGNVPQRIPAQPTLSELDVRRQARDTQEDKVRAAEAQRRASIQGGNATALPMLAEYAKRLTGYSGRDRGQALETAVNEIVGKTGADPKFVYQRLFHMLTNVQTPQPLYGR